MANHIRRREKTHGKQDPDCPIDAVHFYVRPVPNKTLQAKLVGKDPKFGYARVVPTETWNLVKLLEEGCYLKGKRVQVIEYERIFLTIMDAIADALKRGKQVTVGDFLTFGTSIRGCVDMRDPKVHGKLALRTWVRCSQKMADRVNEGARIIGDASSRVHKKKPTE